MLSRKLFVLFCAAVALLLLVYTFSGSIQVSPLSSNASHKTVLSFIPQGWSFFTKSPRDIVVQGYIKREGRYYLFTGPNFSIENYFGFSRTARWRSAIIGRICGLVKAKSWSYCRDLKFENYQNTKCDTIRGINLPSMSGTDFIFVEYNILPWAWAGRAAEVKLIYKVAKVHVI